MAEHLRVSERSTRSRLNICSSITRLRSGPVPSRSARHNHPVGTCVCHIRSQSRRRILVHQSLALRTLSILPSPDHVVSLRPADQSGARKKRPSLPVKVDLQKRKSEMLYFMLNRVQNNCSLLRKNTKGALFTLLGH